MTLIRMLAVSQIKLGATLHLCRHLARMHVVAKLDGLPTHDFFPNNPTISMN